MSQTQRSRYALRQTRKRSPSGSRGGDVDAPPALGGAELGMELGGAGRGQGKNVHHTPRPLRASVLEAIHLHLQASQRFVVSHLPVAPQEQYHKLQEDCQTFHMFMPRSADQPDPPTDQLINDDDELSDLDFTIADMMAAADAANTLPTWRRNR